jgi:hypothetical protein
METPSPQYTDHEQILLIRQDIKNIKDGQDEFHVEMKASIKDLKDNYAVRLDTLDARTSALETARNIIIGFCILAGVCSALIVYIYIHDQAVQDAQISQLLNSNHK